MRGAPPPPLPQTGRQLHTSCLQGPALGGTLGTPCGRLRAGGNGGRAELHARARWSAFPQRDQSPGPRRLGIWTGAGDPRPLTSPQPGLQVSLRVIVPTLPLSLVLAVGQRGGGLHPQGQPVG